MSIYLSILCRRGAASHWSLPHIQVTRFLQFALLFGLVICATLAADGPLVSAGGSHTCAIRDDHSIACWGSDEDGQSTPPSGTFMQLSSGSRHTCGLRTDRTVACWGSDENGRSTPPSGTFNQLSSGGGHTCGLRTDHTVTCWGWDFYGQASPPGGMFNQISSGQTHSCGVRADSTADCWGSDNLGKSSPPDNFFTQVSTGDDHTCGLYRDGTAACWGKNNYGQANPEKGTFIQLSAGRRHNCGVRTDGTLGCWGSNYAGNTSPPSGTFAQVSVGENHTCGVHTDGVVVCWGNDDSGRAKPPDGTFTQLSSGQLHTCGVQSDGTVVCWGSGTSGQASPPLGTFRQISTGVWSIHNCGVRTDSTLSCWGWDYYGQASPPDGTFQQVSAGSRHTCEVSKNGAVTCHGNNDFGQIIPPVGIFEQVSAGLGFNCGLRTDAAIVCWGLNDTGQANPPEGTFTQVSAGGAHTCGVRTDETITCWGSNSKGESSPPSGLFNLVSAGRNHTCGLRTNSTLACWGADDDGQATPPNGMFNQVSTGDYHSCGVRTNGKAICWGFNGYGYAAVPEGLRSDTRLLKPPLISFNESHLLNVSTNGPTVGFGLRAGFIVQGQTQRFVIMGENQDGMENPILYLFNLTDNSLIEQNDTWQTHPTAIEVENTLRKPGNSSDGAFAISLPQGRYYAELQDAASSGQGLVSVTVTDTNNFQQTYPINLSTRGPSPLRAGFIVNGDSARCFIVKAEGPHLGNGSISNPALIVRRYDPLHPDEGEIIDANDSWADHPSMAMVRAAGLAPTDSREAALAIRLTSGVYLAELYSVFEAEEGGDSIVAVTELPEVFLQQASCDTARITKATPTIPESPSVQEEVKVLIVKPSSTGGYYQGADIHYQGDVITTIAEPPQYQWDFGSGVQWFREGNTMSRKGIINYGSAGNRILTLTVRANGRDYQAEPVEITVLDSNGGK